MLFALTDVIISGISPKKLRYATFQYIFRNDFYGLNTTPINEEYMCTSFHPINATTSIDISLCEPVRLILEVLLLE
jgi:hypothetical protein